MKSTIIFTEDCLLWIICTRLHFLWILISILRQKTNAETSDRGLLIQGLGKWEWNNFNVRGGLHTAVCDRQISGYGSSVRGLRFIIQTSEYRVHDPMLMNQEASLRSHSKQSSLVYNVFWCWCLGSSRFSHLWSLIRGSVSVLALWNMYKC